MSRWLVLLTCAVVVPSCGESEIPVDSGIETFPDEGSHPVPVGAPVDYGTDPPTSGPHYPYPVTGGFYTRPLQAGSLVDSMEEGGVIVYYDSDHVAPGDLDRLRNLTIEHPGPSNQVVAVPRTDATFPVILTAWTHRLRLTLYDPARIDGFIALFLGQRDSEIGQRAATQ